MGSSREMARVTYRMTRGRPCDAYFPQPTVQAKLKLPPLRPMPDARVSSSGGGGSSNEVDSRATVSGDALDPAKLLAHYASQLIQAGWKTGAPAIGARVAAQFFEAADDAGTQWQGTLMVSGANTSMNLTLVMRPR